MTDKDKKKLTASLILLIVAAVALGTGIYLLVAMISGQMDFSLLFLLPFLIFLIAISISYRLNRSYRKDEYSPCALSTVILVISCILFLPLVLDLLLMWLLSFIGSGGYESGNYELKTVTVTGNDGTTYILKQQYYNAIYYNDQYGEEWVTYDGGVTFKRTSKDVKAKDDKGNEHTLTPTYEGFTSQYYKDEKGEEWVSKDGGQTAEHLIKTAKVKDKDGNEYELTADFAGGMNFTDQNGDRWVTHDDGKTFERWETK